MIPLHLQKRTRQRVVVEISAPGKFTEKEAARLVETHLKNSFGGFIRVEAVKQFSRVMAVQRRPTIVEYLAKLLRTRP